MSVYTTQNTIHLYGADYLGPELSGGVQTFGKYGITYAKNNGICLECQDYLNYINVDSFTTSTYSPKHTYKQTNTHIFGLSKN
jgi:hypothetical protein